VFSSHPFFSLFDFFDKFFNNEVGNFATLQYEVFYIVDARMVKKEVEQIVIYWSIFKPKHLQLKQKASTLLKGY